MATLKNGDRDRHGDDRPSSLLSSGHTSNGFMGRLCNFLGTFALPFLRDKSEETHGTSSEPGLRQNSLDDVEVVGPSHRKGSRLREAESKGKKPAQNGKSGASFPSSSDKIADDSGVDSDIEITGSPYCGRSHTSFLSSNKKQSLLDTTNLLSKAGKTSHVEKDILPHDLAEQTIPKKRKKFKSFERNAKRIVINPSSESEHESTPGTCFLESKPERVGSNAPDIAVEETPDAIERPTNALFDIAIANPSTNRTNGLPATAHFHEKHPHEPEPKLNSPQVEFVATGSSLFREYEEELIRELEDAERLELELSRADWLAGVANEADALSEVDDYFRGFQGTSLREHNRGTETETFVYDLSDQTDINVASDEIRDDSGPGHAGEGGSNSHTRDEVVVENETALNIASDEAEKMADREELEEGNPATTALSGVQNELLSENQLQTSPLPPPEHNTRSSSGQDHTSQDDAALVCFLTKGEASSSLLPDYLRQQGIFLLSPVYDETMIVSSDGTSIKNLRQAPKNKKRQDGRERKLARQERKSGAVSSSLDKKRNLSPSVQHTQKEKLVESLDSEKENGVSQSLFVDDYTRASPSTTQKASPVIESQNPDYNAPVGFAPNPDIPSFHQPPSQAFSATRPPSERTESLLEQDSDLLKVHPYSLTILLPLPSNTASVRQSPSSLLHALASPEIICVSLGSSIISSQASVQPAVDTNTKAHSQNGSQSQMYPDTIEFETVIPNSSQSIQASQRRNPLTSQIAVNSSQDSPVHSSILSFNQIEASQATLSANKKGVSESFQKTPEDSISSESRLQQRKVKSFAEIIQEKFEQAGIRFTGFGSDLDSD